jgi:hypothetical protein
VPLEEAQDTEDGCGVVFVKRQLGPEIDIEQKVKHVNIPYLTKTYQQLGDRFSFRLPLDTINCISDVLELDRFFLRDDKPGFVVGCILMEHPESGVLGQVWYFTKPSCPGLCGIYGIKTNIINILGGADGKGIATKLLEEVVYPLACLQGCHRLVVPWPLSPMVSILRRLGFTEHNTSEDTPERSFLKEITMTSNYYTIDLK